MNEKAKPTSDPFPHLPRRALFADRNQRTVQENHVSVNYMPRLSPAEMEGVKAAVQAIADNPNGRIVIGKRGRPSSGRPWLAAGVSRSKWFAMKKVKA